LLGKKGYVVVVVVVVVKTGSKFSKYQIGLWVFGNRGLLVLIEIVNG